MRLAVLTAVALAFWSGVADAADRTPPTRPVRLSAAVRSSAEIDLHWNSSSDNVKVAGYVVYRNRKRVTSVTGTADAEKGGHGLSPKKNRTGSTLG